MLIVIGIAVAGCSQLSASFPDALKLPEKLLSKDDQKGKVDAMSAEAQKHETDAAKTIEAAK
jgi:hypothetical protein